MLGQDDRPAGNLDFVLVALGTVAVQIAATDSDASMVWPVCETVVLLLGASALRYRVSWMWGVVGKRGTLAAPVLLASWPMVAQVFGGIMGWGLPLEVLLLKVLQGTAIGLAAVPSAAIGRRATVPPV